MFENIGKKIKTLAKVLCWIGIVLSVISGVAAIIAANGQANGGAIVLGGVLTIVLGVLLSWIGSFFTYGFGQLIENTDAIRSNTAARSSGDKGATL